MPKRFLLGIAGPIAGSKYKLTNSGLKITPCEIVRDFKLTSAEFMNDFPAQALGALVLDRGSMRKIGNGEFHENGIRAVLGPGTGFGLSMLVPIGSRWTILPAEAGYVDLGLGTGFNQKRELQIQPFLKKSCGRQTVETLISGPGLENIYQAILHAEGVNGNGDHSSLSATQISSAAMNGDAAASEAVEMFSRLLGRIAGNIALTIMARGGVYVTGGMACKMLNQIERGGFRKEFEHKNPQKELVEKIPTCFVNHELAALEGLANYARTPDSYDLSYASARFLPDNDGPV